MRILITGGGTGGHVTPAVAVVTALRARSAATGRSLNLCYLGSRDGLEGRVMRDLGVPYRAIATGKLRRYLSWRTPLDLARIPLGVLQAAWHIARFRPAVIFSTGGYVCVPPILAGRLLGVPAITHEQTARSGLANRIAARFARVVAISVPESATEFPPGRTVLTGNPLRADLLGGDAVRGAQHWGFDAALAVVYITGGALGAHAINRAVAAALPRLLAVAQVVHQVGEGPDSSGADLRAAQAQAAADPTAQARYRPLAFVGPELADVYALAWLVVGRAGAGTVNELAALGKPAVLIPLPGAASDEQTANARRLVAAGAAVLLPQPDLTPAHLATLVSDLLADPARRAAMCAAGPALAHPDAAARLVDLILRVAERKS